jgi:hypothetical protein
MPGSLRSGLFAALAVLTAARPGIAQTPVPFGLTGLVRPLPDQTDPLTVYVSTTGTVPPSDELLKAENWRLFAKNAGGNHRITINELRWEEEKNTGMVSLVLAAANMRGIDHRVVAWRAVYLGGGDVLLAELDAPVGTTLPDRFKVAKGKDDAAVYAFGSLLAGPSTKPLYVIDVKFDYKKNIGSGPWRWALLASANTNTDAKPPVDTVEVDADAIETSFSLVRRVNVNKGWLFGVRYTVVPFKGEFSRDTFVADGLTTGELQLNVRTIADAVTIYPRFGYEIGHSIRKPAKIGEQSVDLSDWNTIARATAGIAGQWTLFKSDLTPDDLYHVTVGAAYIARFLGRAEPFVEGAIANGERVDVITVGRNTRHHAEAEANWNFMKYASLSLKYKYGSQPPLFKLVDHQWTLGVTVKAAQKP